MAVLVELKTTPQETFCDIDESVLLGIGVRSNGFQPFRMRLIRL